MDSPDTTDDEFKAFEFGLSGETLALGFFESAAIDLISAAENYKECPTNDNWEALQESCTPVVDHSLEFVDLAFGDGEELEQRISAIATALSGVFLHLHRGFEALSSGEFKTQEKQVILKLFIEANYDEDIEEFRETFGDYLESNLREDINDFYGSLQGDPEYQQAVKRIERRERAKDFVFTTAATVVGMLAVRTIDRFMKD